MGPEWNVKGYIFDYGGTLDTGGHHWGQMLWHAYRQTGVPVTEQRFREAYVEVERFLGKNPVIESNYTFRQTLSENTAPGEARPRSEKRSRTAGSPGRGTATAAPEGDAKAGEARSERSSRCPHKETEPHCCQPGRRE